jgi:hypothetical protein
MEGQKHFLPLCSNWWNAEVANILHELERDHAELLRGGRRGRTRYSIKTGANSLVVRVHVLPPGSQHRPWA